MRCLAREINTYQDYTQTQQVSRTNAFTQKHPGKEESHWSHEVRIHRGLRVTYFLNRVVPDCVAENEGTNR